jgi:hypothetical protein
MGGVLYWNRVSSETVLSMNSAMRIAQLLCRDNSEIACLAHGKHVEYRWNIACVYWVSFIVVDA